MKKIKSIILLIYLFCFNNRIVRTYVSTKLPKDRVWPLEVVHDESGIYERLKDENGKVLMNGWEFMPIKSRLYLLWFLTTGSFIEIERTEGN